MRFTREHRSALSGGLLNTKPSGNRQDAPSLCSRVANHPAPAGVNAGGYMRAFIIAVAALFLGACASTQMMTSDDEAVVSVQAMTTLTTVPQLQAELLKKAAKLALGHGYAYFILLDGQDTTQTVEMYLPGGAQTYGTATAWGNTATYSGNTTYQPPRMLTGQHVGAQVRVKMFTEKPSSLPEGVNHIYEASAILGKS